jgi:hypothetical protein
MEEAKDLIATILDNFDNKAHLMDSTWDTSRPCALNLICIAQKSFLALRQRDAAT